MSLSSANYELVVTLRGAPLSFILWVNNVVTGVTEASGTVV